ncbi:MAG: hypothetical protein Q7O66_07380 [Dehalococcoidia bacterium]|nr:hypothetical protein [Dehalococcoidia bacterium]
MDEYVPVDLDQSGLDGSEVSADGEGQAVEAQGVEQSVAVEERPVVDWEANDNPYKGRYTGIQPEFKRIQVERDQLAQQVAQAQEELAVSQALANGATDDEVKAVRKNWDDQKQVAGFLQAMAQEVAKVEQAKQSLMPAARQQALTMIAKEHGVKVEDLAEAEGPEMAIAMAKVLQRAQKGQVLQQRRTNGTDRAPSGGGGHTDLSKLSALEKIRMGIDKEKSGR